MGMSMNVNIDLYYELVKEFHQVYECAIGDGVTEPSLELMRSRDGFIDEERVEFKEAFDRGSEVGMVDADVDTLYFIMGNFVARGYDPLGVFMEVHRSNMSKTWPDDRARIEEHFKVLSEKLGTPINWDTTTQRKVTYEFETRWVIKRKDNGKVLKGPDYFEPNLLPHMKPGG